MLEIRRLFVEQRKDIFEKWAEFLAKSSISVEKNVDYTCGLFENETMIATASLSNNIIKCVAIDPDYRGGNAFNILITHLIEISSLNGSFDFYVYTKPEFKESFERLGFHEIASVENTMIFMEKSLHGIDEYLSNIQKYKSSHGVAGAVVMNANPFTKGHLHLVQTASESVDILYVFVVEEDRSEFSFETRIRLVKDGCEEITNVIVLSTGNYMVSSKTFPSYFIKESTDVTKVQARLDAHVFKERIAPVLNITQRFVGEEPFSIATNIYNNALKSVLEPEIQLNVIERKEVNNQVISATTVRTLLKEQGIESVRDFVPLTTFNYLSSYDGQETITSLKTQEESYE